MSLFQEQANAVLYSVEPLAARMRPRDLDEFVGQQNILGPGKLLRRLLEADRLNSAIFYGPPGCGKTALAGVIAARTRAAFESLHAATAGVKDIRLAGENARRRLLENGRRTVLFLDEIHRFNRGQQDALLRDVEAGVLTLIGATTENPFYSINSPLISRSSIFQFEPLTPEQIANLCRRALADEERGLAGLDPDCDPAAIEFLAEIADGDARRALNALEAAVLSQCGGDGPPHVTVQIAAESVQCKALTYDRAGDAHYDVTSAFIKSMRGSDPDAALYWLARMLESGEDPRFIARRIAICASEDVGNADPRALLLAAGAAQIVELVGLPECQFVLAQAAIYIACSPKSNAVATAIGRARKDVRDLRTIPVPPPLRDASRAAAARLGHGVGYKLPHDFPGGVVVQDYLGQHKCYYNPTDRGEERRFAAYLEQLRQFRRESGVPERPEET